MEDWYRLLRNLKDESDDPNTLGDLATKIFTLLSTNKLKDKQKFMNRMGPEYESFVSHLSESFPPEMVQELLRNDEFFTLTMTLQQRFRR